jgi:hypothetical protein
MYIFLMQYNVFIYHPDGRLAANYSAYDCGLGIKSVAWSPSGQFLGIGSFDERVSFTYIVSITKPPDVVSNYGIGPPQKCSKTIKVL